MVGAPKCGTTALYRCLEEHPEIFVPGRKEIHYFGSDFYSPTYIRDLREYLSLFTNAGGARRVGEASVWYLFSKRAAIEIKNFCRHARIIIMLRNPVEMVYSLHSQHLYNGTEEIEDFAAALAAEEDRKRGHSLPVNVPAVERLFYREVGKYAAQVARYMTTFGPDQVKVIIYDDFKTDPVRICSETFDFLEVAPAVEPQLRLVNPNKQLRSRAAQAFLDHPPRLLSRVARPLTTSSMRHRLFSIGTRANTSYVSRPPLKEALRRQLQSVFASDVAQLGDLLKRDLTPWCRD